MPPDANSVRELFDRALALPESERAAFLDAACDAGARREVESLLAFHARAGEFLEQPLAFLPPRAIELERGARVGAFVVRERLGEGGMGVVYLAEQLAPVRRQVALKLLKASAESGEQAARFALESQALALMDHRNVARIHAAGTTDDARPFFAMEHVPGTPLSRYCDERELDVERRLRLFLDVCAGVEHAHQKGIVHRDLKPSNVLVREDGGVATPKIIDFGVAKALVRGLTDQTLRTSPGMVIGTLDYMSPEQALSEGRDVDARTDVYSLGAVLYELLIGCLPYEFRARRDLTIAAVHRAFAHEDPLPPSRRLDALGGETQSEVARLRSTSPSALRALLAHDLDWIVGKAIEKERARRYASAAELASDVERFLRHEPVLAKPPSVAYRARKFVRRNKLWVAIVVTLLAGLLATSWAAIDAWRARRRADRNLALIEEQRNHLLPLADYARWQSLRQEADRLWPAEPRMLRAMDDWIARARELASRRPQHAALLATYDSSHGVRLDVPDADRPGTELTGAEVDTYFALINRLVRGLERFEDPSGPTGSLREMEARRAFAWRIEHDSLVAPAEQWQRAIASVADRSECPRYAGLRLRPQLGLVPLWRSTQTGLWEFAHLQTGRVPERDGTTVGEEGAVVLVLIPAEPAPFFIARCDLTCAQWLRLGGIATGDDDLGQEAGGEPRAPVMVSSRTRVTNVLAHGRLEVPSAAQWEQAARACSNAAWWTERRVTDASNRVRPVRALDK